MSPSSGPSCRYHPAEKYVGYGHAKGYEENDERGLLFKFVRQTKYVTVLSESTVIDETGLVAIPVIGSGSTVADGAEGFKNEMEGCIHTLKNGYQKASAREFIHMLHQSTAIWKTMGE